MGKLRIAGRKRVWLTAALSFLAPGLGHLFNGLYARGFLLLAGLLLDYTAIFRLADEDGGRHLLLIVYLGLMLPVFYFISVYDSLQGMDAEQPIRPAPVKLAHGILLTLAGLAMMVLVKPPSFLLPWLNDAAELAVGPLLMLLAAALVIPVMRQGTLPVYKLGRMTAAALLVATGALLISDLLRSRNDMALLGEWWPLLFVLLGLEMVLCSTALRRRWSRLRLDASGISAALVVTVTAYAVTQYADFPVRWLDQFHVDLNSLVDYGEEQGFRYEKNVTKLPLDPEIAFVRIRNANGDVKVRMSDTVREIEIYATVWVDAGTAAEADAIAEESTLQVSPGREVVLESKGKAYGEQGNRLPKINMDIIMPVIKMEPLTGSDDEESAVPGSGFEPQSLEGPLPGPTSSAPGEAASTDNETPSGDEALPEASSDAASALDRVGTPLAEAAEPFGERSAAFNAVSAAEEGAAATGSGGTVREAEAGGAVQEAESGATVREAEAGGAAQETEGDGTFREAEAGGAVQEAEGGATVREAGDDAVPEAADGETERGADNAAPQLAFDIDVGNGAVEVDNVVAAGGLRIVVGSGVVRVTDVTGAVSVKGNDGSIEAVRIAGECNFEIKNGTILAHHIADGPLYAETANGNVELRDIGGDVVVETKNGEIAVTDAAASVKVDTLNGDIAVDSGIVGGNWDLDSSVGEIALTLPYDGNYSLYGSVTFGKITTELPFDAVRKTVRGTVGGGFFRIHINATNSISIRSRQ